MQILTLTQAQGPLWDQSMAIYCEVFPQWEREPIDEMAAAVNAGSSRCIVAVIDGKAVGMTLTELYPQMNFALLGYLFISPNHQGQGLGKQLCQELFDYFAKRDEYHWLLVEAEAGPEKFYQRLGFIRFNIEFLSPHYDDDQSTPMALMYHAESSLVKPTPEKLTKMVGHIFRQSYYLSDDDPRLIKQLAHIQAQDAL
ncbi:GNAT family N-acetyltransferase [Shewanella sp. WXL01]|uniref:GNAT family N-acetyltransferase n=1 Tax=Shewanella maritima TaxID=2520507 RepID=A0A411PF38_9GAMM|nr:MULTISPECIES: GNAT family N-acetyltransferase [Shewanella]NKF49849.1 GNAT family N-acetyltransferase [Shewanella sp. WXL01]QBF82088.1 GNAT family N-acetyltransferase [Shewanella maritima]